MSVTQSHIVKASAFPSDTQGGNPAYWDRLERTLAIIDNSTPYVQTLHISAELQPLSYVILHVERALQSSQERNPGYFTNDAEAWDENTRKLAETREALLLILDEESIERAALKGV